MSDNKNSHFTFDNVTRCPKCNLICSLEITADNNTFINYACEGKHKGKIELKEYMNEYRDYSISKELCNNCGISQKDRKEEFMYCSNCNKFICYACTSKHRNHEKFPIDKYDSLCKKHFNLFSSYCKDCKINLCALCMNEHKNHTTINLIELQHSNNFQKKLEKDIKNFQNIIDDFDNKKADIISLFDKLKEQSQLKINLMKLLLNTYQYNENKKLLNFYTYNNLNICKKQFKLDKNKFSSLIEDLNKYIQDLKLKFAQYNKIKKPETIIYNQNNDILKHIHNDYNFDDKPRCEEKIFHPMTKEIKEDNIEKTSINQPKRNQSCDSINKKIINKENIKDLYKFSCKFPNNGIYEFDLSKEFRVVFLIKNTGNIDWKENEIFLKTNKNSQLKIKDYKVNALRIGESKKIKLYFPNEIKDGNYNVVFDFCFNNQICGEPIKFVVKILPDDDENLLKVIEFRMNFDLDENDFPNEKILKALKKNNFDYEKTFQDIFNNVP